MLTMEKHEKKYLSYKEVKEIYGISRTLIDNLVYERKITRAKVGRTWRYPVRDLERVFTEHAK